ncbi:MAG: ribonuclease III [Gammaproteobacteria bacterium]|nr:ribonuclease III [Gammaproteobacteria bacterium]
MSKAAQWAEAVLSYAFSDTALLNLALTHRSAASEHNERLEYLGDAVLELVITNALYRLKPRTDEGGLSRLRSFLVRKGTLVDIGGEIKIAEQLVLGSGEKRTGGHQRASILADSVEAVLGAVYLDGGYSAAEQVVERLFASRLKSLPDDRDLKDPKTMVQEYLQSHGELPPDYDVLKISGKAHQQTFKVICKVVPRGIETEASGASRRKAEQQAALQMLELLEHHKG